MPRLDRIKLLLLMSLFAAPALAAWVVHQVWPAPATSIYGELLPPAMLGFSGITDAAGQPADLAALRGRWVLLTVANGDCGSECRRQLHLARQVRIAQGRERERVVQALIQTEGAAPADLAFTYRVSAGALADWPEPARTYVVDPLGRVMLRFPVAVEGRGMLRDLRQLLKASKIG